MDIFDEIQGIDWNKIAEPLPVPLPRQSQTNKYEYSNHTPHHSKRSLNPKFSPTKNKIQKTIPGYKTDNPKIHLNQHKPHTEPAYSQ